MSRLKYFGLAAAGFFLAACQSNSYKIKGTGEGLHEGDTIFLSKDFNEGLPFDTAVVEKGEFMFEGNADSTFLCMAYCSNKHEKNVTLFVEPGNIKVNIRNNATLSTASGTHANEEWQALGDSTRRIGAEINKIASHIYDAENGLPPEEIKKAESQIASYNKQFGKIIEGFAERNIRNEFGRFVLTYFYPEVIEPARHLALIKKLPKEQQKRADVAEIVRYLNEELNNSVGQQLTSFTMNDTEGKAVRLNEEFKVHKVTVIDFWASWCGPCRAEMPHVVKLYNEFNSKGLGIIGISLDNDKGAWLSAIRQMGMKWKQLSDLKGWDNEIAQAMHVQSIPHTVVVDSKGTILARGLRGKELEDFVSDYLKK